ncbi:MAG: hypothetical protein ACK5PF_04900 [bacterium]|jgi:hypothetical protein
MNISFYFPLWGFIPLGLYIFWRLWEGTWTYFLAVYHIKKVEEALEKEGKQLPKVSKFFGYWITLPKGVLHDFLLNMALTIPFLDFPRETLVTGRFQRYADGPDGWRKRLALYIDAQKMEPYDNNHIKKGRQV